MQIIFFNIHNSPCLWDQLVQCCLHKHQFQLLWASLQNTNAKNVQRYNQVGVKSYLNKSLLIINTLSF